MKVYIVGDRGPEHNSIRSIHRNYDTAKKAWNQLRLKLLDDAKCMIKSYSYMNGIYKDIIKNLSCTDPDKIDNYPHETPYIQEREVLD